MQLSNIPGKLVLPFANAGGKSTIPVASQIGITAGAASLTDGFPPLTRTPIAAGGVPPSGLDMNGILYEMSAIVRWANAGGGYPFDGTFATDTNIGGYPKGARIMRSDGTGYWFNTIENNATDPESAGAAAAGWVPDYQSGATSVAMSGSSVTLMPSQYGKPLIVITGTLSANLNLIFPNIVGNWSIINNTTGNFTITGKTLSGTGVVLTSTCQIISDGVNIYSNIGNLQVSSGATLVGYKYDFSGACPTTVKNKLAESVSVTDFYANGTSGVPVDPTGVVDSTAGIQAALNCGASFVFAPKGIYKLSAQIVIPRGTTLYGIGTKETPRWTVADTWDTSKYGTVFNITQGAGTTGADNAAFVMSSRTSIQGISFWYSGQAANVAVPTTYPPTIALLSTGDPLENNNKIMIVQIQNCTFVNSWQAINATVLHEQLLIRDVGISAYNRGIVVDLGIDSDVIDHVLMNTTFTYIGGYPAPNDIFSYAYANGGIGLEIGRSDLIEITNTNIIGFGTGAKIAPITPGHNASGIFFNQCDIEGSANCISIASSATAQANQVVMQNCFLQTMSRIINSVTPASAIVVTGTAANPVINCTFDNVMVASTYATGMIAQYMGYSQFENIQFQNCVQSASPQQVVNLSNCNDLHFGSGSKFNLDPNHTLSTYAIVSDSQRVIFEEISCYGQRNTSSSFYIAGCTDVKVLRWIDNFSLAGAVGQTGSTRCYGECPLNVQGAFTATFTGFPSQPTSYEAWWSQNGPFVTISMEAYWASPIAITQTTSNINDCFTGGASSSTQPPPVKLNASFSAIEANGATPLSNASVVSQKIYPAAASAVTRLCLSGTYLAATS